MSLHELSLQLERLQARWIAGATQPLPPASLPVDWQALHGDELAVLAMASQCQQFLGIPAQPAGVPAQAPLPVLPGRLPGGAARMQLRRLLPQLQPQQLVAMLDMLARRGWTAHPFDWSPAGLAADLPLPTSYDGWRDWVERQAGGGDAEGLDADADDWSRLTSASQRRALRVLRMRDRAQARALFQANAPGLPAPQREALLEVLGERIGEDDLPLLDALAGDRSDKVRTLALRLRARLGRSVAPDDARRDALRGWFEAGKAGLLRRRATMAYAVLKNPAQRRAREEALAGVDWDALATALGLAPLALVEQWQWSDDAPDALLECAVRSGSADVVQAWVERILFERDDLRATWMLGRLAARLDPGVRGALAMRCLRESAQVRDFDGLLALAGGELAALAPDMLFASTMFRDLQASLGALDLPLPARSAAWNELLCLACLLPQATSAAALARLESTPALAADPALDALRLGAALPTSSITEGTST